MIQGRAQARWSGLNLKWGKTSTRPAWQRLENEKIGISLRPFGDLAVQHRDPLHAACAAVVRSLAQPSASPHSLPDPLSPDWPGCSPPFAFRSVPGGGPGDDERTSSLRQEERLAAPSMTANIPTSRAPACCPTFANRSSIQHLRKYAFKYPVRRFSCAVFSSPPPACAVPRP